VIVDLLAEERRYAWPGAVRLALLPGSRERAYADADRIAEIAALVAARVPDVAAVMSVAPSLEAARFAALFERYPALGVWFDGIGGILDGATLAIGQAGTANEAAAASACRLSRSNSRRPAQRLVPHAPGTAARRCAGDRAGRIVAAAAAIVALLNDPRGAPA